MKGQRQALSESEDWFEQVWEYREETLYPTIFGTEAEGGIFTLTFDLFKTRFEQTTVDPRWLHHGVLVFPPTGVTASWRFVTSGLSNAWDADSPDAHDWFGLGREFLLEAPENARWALNVTLSVLAYQLLLAGGRFGDPRLIDIYHRIPVGGPIDGLQSALTHVFIGPSPIAPEDVQLASGKFALLQLVGATETEIQFARERSGEELLALLKDRGAYPVTNPLRAAVL